MSLAVPELLLPQIALFGLVAIRIAVTLVAMPPPLGDIAPVQSRVVLSILLTVALALSLEDPPPAPVDTLGFAGAAVGEACVGVVIGLTVRAALAAAAVAGGAMGMSMGLGFATFADPTLGEDRIPTARLLVAFAGVIFFALGGHRAVIAALGESLRIAPPGRGADILENPRVLQIGSASMAHGLQIAAPVVATMFLVHAGSALIARTAPRLHVFALTIGVAAAVGLVTLAAASPWIAHALASEMARLPEALGAALGR